jgi:hypothetical protein
VIHSGQVRCASATLPEGTSDPPLQLRMFVEV